MRALTVQQPWAWAIFHGKDVENRTQAWGYRGPLAIHAGQRWSDRGGRSRLVLQHEDYADAEMHKGAIIGVVDLVDVHVSARGREVTSRARHGHGLESHRLPDCCSSPWGEFAEGPTKPVVHLELANPRPLATPIPAKGRLGLWTPDADLLAQIREQVRA